MKKVLSIFISLIFLLTTSYLTLSQHYCYGDLLNTEILLSGQPSHCGMDENHYEKNSAETTFQQQCCQHILQQLEVNGQSQIAHFNFDFNAFFATIKPINFRLLLGHWSLKQQLTHSNFKYNILPPDIPIYKRIEVFLI